MGKHFNMGKVRFKEQWVGSRFVAALVSLSLCTAAVIGDTSSMIDPSDSVIVSGSNSRAIKVAEFLQTEIQNRTGITLVTSTSMPAETVVAIVIGSTGYYPAPYTLPPGLSVPTEDEGYALWVSRTARPAPTVYLVGRDDKGTLFAAGMLLRKLYLANNLIRLDDTIKIATSPAYPMRGHQMLRSTQSNDGFVNWGSIPQLEQYVRDLALFGTNTIEPTGPEDLDEFLEELGIDLQIWTGGNIVLELNGLTDQEVRDEFSYLTGIDHFFTPGGDTSSSRLPMDVLPALERVAPLVMEGHSGSKWWYSNQCQDDHALDYDDYTFDYIQTNQPTWLYGMVYGPWTKRGIPEIRADLPSQYKIRHYPDICHVRWCQYVVPKWDHAWAQVWDRNKSIYAMPEMMRDIHNATMADTVGSVPYNHIGSYNDLNKFIFSAMGWDPNTDVNDVLYDYARVFFAYQYRDCSAYDITGDCIVNFKDYALLANDWLKCGYYKDISGTEPNENALWLWYKFDETGGLTANDSSGRDKHGTLTGTAGWDNDGYDAGCLSFNDNLVVNPPSSTLETIDDTVTFSMWVRGDDCGTRENWVFDIGDGTYVNAMIPDSSDNVTFTAAGDYLTWADSNLADWQDYWVHYAFVKDAATGIMRIYRNGHPVAEKTDAFASMSAIQNTIFDIGAKRSHANDYMGDIDDIRIYDYALSVEEITYVANSTGSLYVPLNSAADYVGDDDCVDANDFVYLIGHWIEGSADSNEMLIDAATAKIAQALKLIGNNWVGPISENTTTEQALELWKEIAVKMGGADTNWRLEMFLTKAFIDAQVKRKYDAEMIYQQAAYDALAQAGTVGVSTAVANARAQLARIDTEFQSLGDFKAEMLSWGLGSGYGDLDETLDSLYQPLTDRIWLENRLNSVTTLVDIDAIINYEDPNTGGFYDNLGVYGQDPHLVRQMTWQEDPGFVHSPIEWMDHSPGSSRRLSQLSHATARYYMPLIMRWEGLDPGASYHIEIVYLGPFGPQFTCETDDGYLIHDVRGNGGTDPDYYSIPPASTADGALQLEWNLTNVVRGVSVTEIWLKKD